MKKHLFNILLTVFLTGTAFAETPMLYYPFDGDANDSLGNYNATTDGGVTFVTDSERGECALLDGTDGVIYLPSEIWDSGDTATTITCWFNWSGGDNWQRLYSLGLANGGWNLFYFCVRDGEDGPRWTFDTDDLGWKEYYGDTLDFDTVSYNQWYFTALVLTGDSIKIYMDDDIIVEEDLIVAPLDFQEGDTSANVIGKSHWSADPTFNGMVDDFRIYDKALSHSEVLSLFNADNTTAVNENNVINDIKFYGVDGNINYIVNNENDISNVAVYSLTGRLMFNSSEISDLNNQKFESGIYIVTVIQGENLLTKKIVL